MKRNNQILIDILRTLENNKSSLMTGDEVIKPLQDKSYAESDIVYHLYLLYEKNLI